MRLRSSALRWKPAADDTGGDAGWHWLPGWGSCPELASVERNERAPEPMALYPQHAAARLEPTRQSPRLRARGGVAGWR